MPRQKKFWENGDGVMLITHSLKFGKMYATSMFIPDLPCIRLRHRQPGQGRTTHYLPFTIYTTKVFQLET